MAVFLRAINVGSRRLAMGELRERVAAIGFTNVRTLQAAGNLVIGVAAPVDAGEIEARIETALRGSLGYEVTTFVRTLAELEVVVDRVPDRPGSHQVGFLKRPPTDDAARAAEGLSSSADEVVLIGREVHWWRPEPMASRLAYATIERALGTGATFRTAGTVRKILAMGLADPG